jgi:hypothetical protein
MRCWRFADIPIATPHLVRGGLNALRPRLVGLLLCVLTGSLLAPHAAQAAGNPSISGIGGNFWKYGSSQAVDVFLENTSAAGASDHIDNIQIILNDPNYSISAPITLVGAGKGSGECKSLRPRFWYCDRLDWGRGATLGLEFDTSPQPYPSKATVDVQPFANNPYAAGEHVTLAGPGSVETLSQTAVRKLVLMDRELVSLKDDAAAGTISFDALGRRVGHVEELKREFAELLPDVFGRPFYRTYVWLEGADIELYDANLSSWNGNDELAGRQAAGARRTLELAANELTKGNPPVPKEVTDGLDQIDADLGRIVNGQANGTLKGEALRKALTDAELRKLDLLTKHFPKLFNGKRDYVQIFQDLQLMDIDLQEATNRSLGGFWNDVGAAVQWLGYAKDRKVLLEDSLRTFEKHLPISEPAQQRRSHSISDARASRIVLQAGTAKRLARRMARQVFTSLRRARSDGVSAYRMGACARNDGRFFSCQFDLFVHGSRGRYRCRALVYVASDRRGRKVRSRLAYIPFPIPDLCARR